MRFIFYFGIIGKKKWAEISGESTGNSSSNPGLEKAIVEILNNNPKIMNSTGADIGLSGGKATQGSIVLTFEADSKISVILLKEQFSTGSIKSTVDQIFRKSGVNMDELESIDVQINVVVTNKGTYGRTCMYMYIVYYTNINTLWPKNTNLQGLCTINLIHKTQCILSAFLSSVSCHRVKIHLSYI